MVQLKRRLAIALTVLLLVSATFAASFAANNTGGQTAPSPRQPDSFFRLSGLLELPHTSVYVLPYSQDSYYDSGYQTVFFIGDEYLTHVTPTFWQDDSVHIYTGHGDVAHEEIVLSGETTAPLLVTPLKYTAVGENGTELKHYSVSFVPKTWEGPNLFINGVNEDDTVYSNEAIQASRDVYLTRVYDNTHSIYLANVGSDTLEELTATLTDEQHVKLASAPLYESLAAFTSTEADAFEQSSTSIILEPDGEGEIRGTLTITAYGQMPIEIELSGYAGDPKITTSTIPDAMKNTPYSAQVQYENVSSSNTVALTLGPSSTLPPGITLHPDGSLSGTPSAAGTFTFDIHLTNSDRRFADSYATYTMQVAANPNDHVPTSTGHVVDSIPMTSPELVTLSLPHAVKYVPYAMQVLQHNDASRQTMTLSLVSGALPEGVIVKPNGELYGVPKEAGTFTIEIRLSSSNHAFEASSATYTLVVDDNTIFNVDRSTDSGYEISKRVGKRVCCTDVIEDIADYEFITEGDISEFIAFWLNGERLTEHTDYTKEPGSTKITIRSQTFENKANKNGNNTIAAEFRVDGDENKEMKRAAQNFTITPKPTPSPKLAPAPSPKPAPAPSPTPSPSPAPKPAPQPVIQAPVPISETITVPIVVVNGMAMADVTSAAVTKALAHAVEQREKASTNRPIVIEALVTEMSTDVSEAHIVIPTAIMEQITAIPHTSLRVNGVHLGSVTWTAASLHALASEGGKVVGIYIQKGDNSATVCVTMDDEPLATLAGGVRVSLPGLAANEAVLVTQLDGRKTMVKKSIVEDGHVYALLGGSGTIQVINRAHAFRDVHTTDWFSDAIRFVNSRELFVGVNESTFAAHHPMTRAMLATVFHRLEDAERNEAKAKFTDVSSGQWYSDGISWASAVELVTGIGNGVFGVSEPITREQLAVFLYRYANYLGMDTVERGSLQRFSDAGEISTWANHAVRWAVGTGLMQGDGKQLHPTGEALRAQVAVMLMRFIDFFVK